MRTFIAAAIVFVIAGQPGADWLPPPIYEGFVEQLSDRLSTIQPEWSRERRRNAAAAVVGALRTRLLQLTHDDIRSRAPALKVLNVPVGKDPKLDAIARYQLCSAADFIAHERADRDASEDARSAVVMRLTAGAMTVLYLRDGVIDGGGTDEQIEAFLADKVFAAVVDRIQRDPALLLSVQEECAPVFRTLLAP